MGRIRRYRTALIRHHRSKGHGIHSPFAFNFVRFVLREKSPYYCYDDIDELRQAVIEVMREHWPHRRVASFKDLKMLFRITNFFNPQHILQVGTGYGLTAATMLNVSSTSELYLYEPSLGSYPVVGNVLAPYLDSIESYNSLEVARDCYSRAHGELHEQPFVLVNSIPEPGDLAVLRDYLMRLVESDCVIVMRRLNHDERLQALWNEIKAAMTCGQSFTNEKMGLVYVSKKYTPEHFFLWF